MRNGGENENGKVSEIRGTYVKWRRKVDRERRYVDIEGS
jgi:hypothetical protein